MVCAGQVKFLGMKVTTKGLYAVQVLVALALHKEGKALSVSDIEERAMVPYHYAEKLLLRLKRVGMVRSLRGIEGGYILSKKPREISLADIFDAVGEPITPWLAPSAVEGFTPSMPKGRILKTNRRRPMMCPVHPVWQRLYQQNMQFFEKTKLSEFSAQQ